MIDINELRRLTQAATLGPWVLRTAPTSAGLCHVISAADWRGAFIYGDGLRIGVDDLLPKAQELAANAHLIAAVNPVAISELLDRLEAAEKERDALRSLVVMRFDHDYPPQFTQGYDTHELTEPVTAEHCRWFVDEIERLRAKLEAAEKERDALRAAVRHEADCVEAAKTEIKALRAKVAEMEQQEPSRLVTPTAYRWRYRGAIKWQYGELTEETVRLAKEHNHEVQPLGVLPGAQQCKNCNGMGDRFDQSGEKIPCDLCESHLEEIRSLVTEAVHDIISGSDFWLSISLAAKKIYALPGAKGEEK